MWPFTKLDERPRILLIDDWRGGGAVDLSVQRVDLIRHLFTFSKYSGTEIYILEPGGTVRGRSKMTWEKIDDIAGLTDVAIKQVAAVAAEGQGFAVSGEGTGSPHG